MVKANDSIGPYTLISKLGRGAFGVVWLAEKRTLITTTKVALKLPNDEDVDLDAIKQEASLWVHASGHPNVLPIIDADIYDDQIIIVSEYAPDGSLSKWLKLHGAKAPSVESAVEMMLGILAGLEHLHERGIIHRDLKPDNILLQRETPRLADFGIARILKTTSKSTAASGTPAYMPPEAFDGKRSRQTDIWSAGVIFYQLLTGGLPFPQTEFTQLVGAILTREPEPLPASIPRELQNIIRRSLQKTPAKRYESTSEMRKALRNAVQPKPIDSSSEAKTKILPAKVVDLQPTVLAKRPNRRLWIIGSSVFLSLIGAIAIILFNTSTNNSNASKEAMPSAVITPTPTTVTSTDLLATPTKTFMAFYEASKAKDVPGVIRTLSKDSLAFLTAEAKKENKTLEAALTESLKTSDVPTRKPQTRNEKIDGDKATLEVKDDKVADKWDTFNFVKENGEWKLKLGIE